MKQSLGYISQGENMVCKLKKAIYGLKQSPWACFESCVVSSLKWSFKSAIMIIISSFARLLLLWCLLFIFMTFYWLEVMVMVLKKLKSILRINLSPNIWAGLGIFLRLKLLIVKIEQFFLKKKVCFESTTRD